MEDTAQCAVQLRQRWELKARRRRKVGTEGDDEDPCPLLWEECRRINDGVMHRVALLCELVLDRGEGAAVVMRQEPTHVF